MPKVNRKKDASPSVRLAHVPGAQGDNVLAGRHGMKTMSETELPALLVSYYYLDKFLESQDKYCYRNWMLDCGAFSAKNKGEEIDLAAYTDCCLHLMETDPTLVEIVALDVIGDWKASVRNAEYMWKRGVSAIPTFHYGEPWDALKGLAKDYPKIGLGGINWQRADSRDRWMGQCFARIWPKKVHGFGLAGEKTVLGLPFHSTDATNWEMGPCGFGRWQAFGNAHISVRGSKQNLRCEVLWYLDLEERARERWKKEMALLEEKFPIPPLFKGKMESSPKAPNERLAVSGDGTGSKKARNEGTDRRQQAFAPTVRLAESGSRGDGSERGRNKLKALRPREKKGE